MKDQDSDEIYDKISRRNFLKATLAGTSALVAPTIINYLGQSAPSSDKEFLEIRDGNFYKGGEEFQLKGFFYYPKDHGWRIFKDWEPEEVRKELSLGRKLGANTVRTTIDYILSTGRDRKQFEGPITRNDPEPEYFENFEQFLTIADDNDLKVLPQLRNIYWSLYDDEKNEIITDYLDKWVPEFKDDERILAWSIFGEPELNYDSIGKQKVKKTMKLISEKFKKLDKKHPITLGWANPESVEGEPREINFTSFHYYGFPQNLPNRVGFMREYTNNPLVLEEFGSYSYLNPKPTKSEKTESIMSKDYEMYFNQINKTDLRGSIFWTLLDFPVYDPNKFPDWWGLVYSEGETTENHMGVLRTDYSKKPAAHVVEQYYNWIL